MSGDAFIPVASNDKPSHEKANIWYDQAFNNEWMVDIDLKDRIKLGHNNSFAKLTLGSHVIAKQAIARDGDSYV